MSWRRVGGFVGGVEVVVMFERLVFWWVLCMVRASLSECKFSRSVAWFIINAFQCV